MNWIIDNSKCKKCGLCVDICPNRIIEKDESGKIGFIDRRLTFCFKCGQCMAICPQTAIQVPGLTYETDFFELPELDLNMADNFIELIQTRRAIRTFEDKPVPHDLLGKVIDAIKFAPPGFPPVKTEITVIQDPKKIKNALLMMIRFYEDLVRLMLNPFTRQFIKLEAGSEKFNVLRKHLVPLLIDRLPDLKSGKEDTIFRRAPALLLFHADKNAENYANDIYIAIAYGFLAAHALGLGASAMDLIPPAIDKSKELRKFFKIPDGHHVVGSIILGFPKHQFKRGIKRELKSITWL